MDPTLLFRIQRRARRGRAGPQPVDPILLDIHNGFCAYVANTLSTTLGPLYSSTPNQRDTKFYASKPASSAPSAAAATATTTTAAATTTPTPTTNAHLVHLRPPERLMATGCWCPNPSKPRQHYWRTCTCFIPQPIVAPGASAAPCPHPPCSPSSSSPSPPSSASATTAAAAPFAYHPDNPPTASAIAHLFCFDPLAASASYMRWFLAVQGPPDAPPSEDDAAYLGRWLIDCYYTDDHYRAHEVPNPYRPRRDAATGRPAYDARWEEVPATDALAHAHYRLVSRLFTELRGDPPRSDRAGCWFDAERVHAVIRWERMTVQATMDAFLPFVLQAKSQRLQHAAAAAPR
ncbi:hypothetical protein IF1G_05467 [Cordyceps javanica]|uniref:Uncharacterized protein n=1 Tax=Cordyceps javanica TaxID=43265 RepID=A0A545V1P3_9HYPO|nr:hypothetical protein IF1G_05467 [Cordyceps javanica]TQW07158.1 hypothetical protein IF2G_05542 [Cordyceps javanica]